MKIVLTALIAFFSMRAGAQQVIRINGQDTGTIRTNVEIPPMFPGGDVAWSRYLEGKSSYALENTQDSTPGTVVVQFIVDVNAHTRDFKVISGPTTGSYRAEAVRLVRSSGLWMPAVDNGRQVTAYRLLPIHFKMD